MQVVQALVGALFWVAFVLLLAALGRRILGVPVGWARAVIFGLVLVGATTPILVSIVGRAGLVVGGRLVGNPAAAALVSFLTVAWTFTLGLAAVVIFEAILPTGTVPGPATIVRRLRRQRRRTRRYAAIMGIAVRHGLGRDRKSVV